MVRRVEKIPGKVRNEEKSKAGERESLDERETKQSSFEYEILKSKVCHWYQFAI